MKIFKTKKIIFIAIAGLAFTSSLFILLSCNNNDVVKPQNKDVIQNQSGHIIDMDQRVKGTTQFYFNKTTGRVKVKSSLATTNDGSLINELFQSSTWSNIPPNILSDILYSDSITIADYKNTSVKTICFKLKSDKIYKSLVFYCKNSKFTPVIASAEKRGDLKYLVISDLSSNPYFEFYLNNENKMGKFKVYANIPHFASTSLRIKSMATEVDANHCRSLPFSACMDCMVSECSKDWMCVALFASDYVACLAGMAVMCM
jgi:hypothetical protein